MPERLDKILVTLGLAASRERAQAAISAGMVRVDGREVRKPSHPVAEGSQVSLDGDPMPYVGRGGLKLQAALEAFAVDVSGMRCIDVGASTGGFTDCLLQRGAAGVVAVDVGHSQLAPSLRSDPRVELREGVNARNLRPGDFPAQFDLAVIDVSFISLSLVLPPVAAHVQSGGIIIALVKPQFEAGRAALDRRGVVRSADHRRAALESVLACAAVCGVRFQGSMESPIAGGDGNLEYLAHFTV